MAISFYENMAIGHHVSVENQEKKLFVIDVLSIMIDYNRKYFFLQ